MDQWIDISLIQKYQLKKKNKSYLKVDSNRFCFFFFFTSAGDEAEISCW